MNYLNHIYFGNTVKSYLIVAIGCILGILLLNLFNKIFLFRAKKWTKKTKSKIDDYIIEGIERFVLPLLKIFVFYNGIKYLVLSKQALQILENALTVALIFYTVRIITKFLRILLESYVRKSEGGEGKVLQLRGVLLIINVIIWCIGAVFLFSNLGYDVTAIITGLGIGGLAVALAAQTILGDLFNYFVIFFDRPFEIGDVILVGDKRGEVEYIGIKTTRIKSISGEQIIISNSDLTSSRLHNFKRMKARRIAFSVGVTYQTPAQKLKEIPDIVNNIILAQENAEPDRCRFSSYGDFSLNFEIIYHVTVPDFGVYLDVQQSINLSIFEAFEKSEIEFAYPTQTLFVQKNG